MKKRTVSQWAQKQYAGDVQPWPRWVRWSLIALVFAVVAAKIAGLLP